MSAVIATSPITSTRPRPTICGPASRRAHGAPRCRSGPTSRISQARRFSRLRARTSLKRGRTALSLIPRTAWASATCLMRAIIIFRTKGRAVAHPTGSTTGTTWLIFIRKPDLLPAGTATGFSSTKLVTGSGSSIRMGRWICRTSPHFPASWTPEIWATSL